MRRVRRVVAPDVDEVAHEVPLEKPHDLARLLIGDAPSARTQRRGRHAAHRAQRVRALPLQVHDLAAQHTLDTVAHAPDAGDGLAPARRLHYPAEAAVDDMGAAS